VGIKVIRFPAADVLADPEGAARAVLAEMKARWHEQRASSRRTEPSPARRRARIPETMLQIDNLHEIAGKAILKGLSLTVNAGEIHAIMGPNGAGKSTLAYTLGGRPGYEVTGGSVAFEGADLLAMEPHERAAAGLFLGFQYPVEIPGVSNVQFLREALNAQRKAAAKRRFRAASS
jgi:ABC-type uncharacterized transport system ATPase subunit